ncbi:hypothetical protein DPMN_178382 [Dreissena polymorpha]|uniref:Uncharacterized protein n=1 Tax=Dreissena polymorpha TaxID=45954 RepID=A0A9D4EC33_DREPO|nr:hypothetical protein DPMN_178382 [Dreissena polymorpha]
MMHNNGMGQTRNVLPKHTHRQTRGFWVGAWGIINILTKFHKDWMKTTNILTRFHEDWMKTPDFIKINILTKFHKHWMKTVTSTVYTNKLLTNTRTHAHTHIRTPDITRSHKLTMSLRDR